ncbi:MAG: CDP-alcohol phosphatidyltransferase family protein [Acidobacteria bacterium]|nr:CDP-alcohol phosphatidyltransferase family protein [Acidobacteriota bacterium]
MPNFRQVFYAPNQITLLRLIFIPFIIVAILYEQYRLAFALVLIAGVSDGIDGLLARWLHQKTTLGTYLDPIADKLLLTSAFLTLGLTHQIPLWLVILVLSRDVIILLTALVMILTTSAKIFPPSIYGKANTLAQIATVLLTLVVLIEPLTWLRWLQQGGIYLTALLTVVSGLHYAFRTAEGLRHMERAT